MKGNGLFVPVTARCKSRRTSPAVSSRRTRAPTIHRYLLRRVYGVSDSTLRWESHPQEKLLDVLRSAEVDAVVCLTIFSSAARWPMVCVAFIPTVKHGENFTALTR